MRRRIYLIGAAVAALSLVVGVGMALAAKHHKHHAPPPPPPKVVVLSCVMNLSTVPPEGQANVDEPPTQGDTYGPNSCTRPQVGFGSGVAHTSFTVPDSGDTVGTYQQYFKTGTLSGSFDITPNESPPISQTGFYSQTWTGTITLTRVTGTYTGITEEKGTGVLNCSTQDSGVHMTCTERIKILVPVPVSATGTTSSKKS